MRLETLWGLVVLVLSSVCWFGQVITWLAPDVATALGLVEAESDVESAFWADARGEAVWDAVTLWVMVAAGILLLVDNPAWPYFGLVGGGAYLYFAGRGITTRVMMRRRSLRIGSAHSVRVALVALAVWGVMAVVTIVSASMSLRSS